MDIIIFLLWESHFSILRVGLSQNIKSFKGYAAQMHFHIDNIDIDTMFSQCKPASQFLPEPLSDTMLTFTPALCLLLLVLGMHCIVGQILSGDCACVTQDGTEVWDRRK